MFNVLVILFCIYEYPCMYMCKVQVSLCYDADAFYFKCSIQCYNPCFYGERNLQILQNKWITMLVWIHVGPGPIYVYTYVTLQQIQIDTISKIIISKQKLIIVTYIFVQYSVGCSIRYIGMNCAVRCSSLILEWTVSRHVIVLRKTVIMSTDVDIQQLVCFMYD